MDRIKIIILTLLIALTSCKKEEETIDQRRMLSIEVIAMGSTRMFIEKNGETIYGEVQVIQGDVIYGYIQNNDRWTFDIEVKLIINGEAVFIKKENVFPPNYFYVDYQIK